MAATISPGYLSRRSTQPKSHFLWMSHSRHYILSTPTPNISQPPCHPDTSAVIPPGYFRHHFTRILQPPFHPDTSTAVPPNRKSTFSGCLIAAIISCWHLLRISHNRHVTRIPQPPFHLDTSVAILSNRRSPFSEYFTPGCLTVAMPPGYLSRHSNRIPQSPFYPADTPPPPDVSQLPFYRADLTPDIPPSPDTSHPDVSQPPCHPDTSTAIPSGYLSRYSIRPTPHLHPDVSQSPLYPADLTAAIISG